MQFKVLFSKVEKVITQTHFHSDGDGPEREWWPFFKERFPNLESYWRHFVVPSTKRIEKLEIGDQNDEQIGFRNTVHNDIRDISLFHYSVFTHLTYAYQHLQNFGLSSFEDFYTHLASACDCAEEFLLKVYSLTLECSGERSHILEELGRDEFLCVAEEWYNKNYSKVYEHYHKKGKFLAIEIPNRENVLNEYFKNSTEWHEYTKYSQKIRQYRNVIVHNVQIGKILTSGKHFLVPKREKIADYKKLSSVFAASGDIEKLKRDFINMKEQMILDIGNLEIILNGLWNKPIDDMTILLFKDKNETLLKKYDISLT